MKLQEQVCSLELAQELKKLGTRQESLWIWYNCDVFNQSIEIGCSDSISDKDVICSAFTVAELGEMLPNDFMSYKKDNDMWLCCKHHPEIGKDNEMIMEFANIEADARAEMLIYLIENKIVKVEDL